MDVSQRERLAVADVAGPAENGAPVTEFARAATRPRALTAWFWAPLFAISVVLATYTGFRLPNRWSATLDAVSLQDGFHRRFLVGTLLHPLATWLDQDYWLYAAVAFMILFALLVVLAVAALRAPLVSQRFLVIAFLLLPTGGFLFNEVGYLDQLLYLLLFASLWALRRSRWFLAPVLMTLAVVAHEIAILTVVPILGFVVLREQTPRRALAVLAPPVVAAIVILSTPAVDAGAVSRLTAELRAGNFRPRLDALALFQRSQSESWKLYNPGDVFLFLLPFAVVGVVAFLLLYFLDGRPRHGSALYPVLAGGAIAAPVLLAFAGWDEWRWAFLLMANFFIVVWVWLGDRGRELSALQWVTLAFVLFFGLHANLQYFDGYSPRALRPAEIRTLKQQIDDGTLFHTPQR